MPSNFEKLLGERIAMIRKEQNLTQAQFAEILNVTTETVSRLERGISIPSLKTLENISNVLNIPLKELFDFEYFRINNPSEKEIAKIVSILKSKRIDEIKLGYSILRDVYKAIGRVSQRNK